MRIPFRYGLVLMVPAALFAQGQPEIQQILDRLQRLEDQNRELTAEIHALRQLLSQRDAAAHPGETTPEPVVQQSAPEAEAAAPLSERVAVNEQRIRDLDQSKVEAEHKLPVRLTGTLLFNAFMNGRNSGGQQYPVVAAGTSTGATDGGTLRQSIVGLKFDGPEIFGGGKVSGSVFMDFWAGTGTSLNQLVRLRVASVDLSWANTTFSVGQDKPLIAQRDPTSLAQVGVSPLTAAGNLWLWQPQARVEQRLHFGEDAGLTAQVGVYQTSESYSFLPSNYALAGARPGLEGRFELWRQFSNERRIEIAPGFHVSNSHVDGQSIPSRVGSVDWLIRPVRMVDFSGTFFAGDNTAVMGGLRQGLTFGDYDIQPVHSMGGWAQFTFRASSRLSFNIFGGQEDPRNRGLVAGSVAKNQAYAGNIMYRFGSNVLASFEASQTRTTYLGLGTRLNPHYDVAVAYLY